MAEDILENLDNGSPDSEGKKGTTFPVKTQKGIIPFVGSVYQKYGAHDYHGNEIFADANNLAVNSIKSLLSTSQQYGFLKKAHGTGYKITPEFTKIFHPIDERQKDETMVECLRAVPFYKNLFTAYDGQMVPSSEGLVNFFVRDFDMKQNRAKIAADIFLQNLKDLGLVNNRGVLILKAKVHTPHTPAQEAPAVPPNPPKDVDEEDEMIKIPIRLKGKRMAYLSFPNDYTDQDLKRIEKVIKAYVDIYSDKDDKDIDVSDL